LSAILGRAARITLAPGSEWLAIMQEAPGRRRNPASFVLWLACIPAVSWCLGLLVSSETPAAHLAWIAYRGAIVYFGTILSVVLLATSLFAMAPVFGDARSWARSLQVAAYGSAPVLLGGILLVFPDLVSAMLLIAFHGFYLQYVGVQLLLGVKEDRAAEFVALEIVLFSVLATLMGALAGWLGVI
jgi:hypothetical protein